MSTGTRVQLGLAATAAADLLARLSVACERIEVAGSIRRRRPDVGDIELVAVPRYAEDSDGFFGTTTRNLLTEQVDALLVDGMLLSHPTDPKRGERYSKLIDRWSGLQVDLFSARAETFGLLYLIRTGPADYSHRFVTDLRRKSLHAAGGELHRGSLGCGTYECEVVPAPNEEDVYTAAGWPFVIPEMRA